MNFKSYGNNYPSGGANTGRNGSFGGGNGGFNGSQGAEDSERARQAHAALSHPYGDFHTYLHVYNTWENQNRSVQWCERNFVNFRSMKTVASIRYAYQYKISIVISFFIWLKTSLVQLCVKLTHFFTLVLHSLYYFREHLSRDAHKVLDRHNSDRNRNNHNNNHSSSHSRDDKHSEKSSSKSSSGSKKDEKSEASLEDRICTAITAGKRLCCRCSFCNGTRSRVTSR